jgi:hypothetical protein
MFYQKKKKKKKKKKDDEDKTVEMGFFFRIESVFSGNL